MNGIFNFFINALKAIIFSPFYILYFLVFFIICFINHLVGEVKVVITGFKYGSKKENKYNQELQPYIDKYESREKL